MLDTGRLSLAGIDSSDNPLLQAVWQAVGEYNRIAAVPGVIMARRFRATSANRKYVALYHLESPEVIERGEQRPGDMHPLVSNGVAVQGVAPPGKLQPGLEVCFDGDFQYCRCPEGVDELLP